MEERFPQILSATEMEDAVVRWLWLAIQSKLRHSSADVSAVDTGAFRSRTAFLKMWNR